MRVGWPGVCVCLGICVLKQMHMTVAMMFLPILFSSRPRGVEFGVYAQVFHVSDTVDAKALSVSDYHFTTSQFSQGQTWLVQWT